MATGSILKKHTSVRRAIAAGDAPADEGHQSTSFEKSHEQFQPEESTSEGDSSSTRSFEHRPSISNVTDSAESKADQSISGVLIPQPRRRSMPGEMPSETADEEQPIPERGEAPEFTKSEHSHEREDATALNEGSSFQDAAFADELNVTPETDPIQPRTPSMTGAIPPNLPIGVPSQVSSMAPSEASSRRPSAAVPSSRSRKISRARPSTGIDAPSTRASSATTSDRARRRSEKASIANSVRSRAASVGSRALSSEGTPTRSSRPDSFTSTISREGPQSGSEDPHTSPPTLEKSTNSSQLPDSDSSHHRSVSRKTSQATTIAPNDSHKPSHVSFGGETTAPSPLAVESSETLSADEAVTLAREALASRQVSIFEIAPEFREELLSIVRQVLAEHKGHREHITAASPNARAQSEGQGGVSVRLENDNEPRRVISIPQRHNPKTRDRFRWIVLAHGAVLKLLVGEEMAGFLKEYLRLKAGKEEHVRAEYVHDGPPEFVEEVEG